jgi:transposase
MEKKTVNSGVITRRKFDETFKRSTVDLLEKGRSIQELAQTLRVRQSLLHKWKRRYGSPSAVSIVEPAELLELRRRVKELEQECDILKKALGIFSRPS